FESKISAPNGEDYQYVFYNQNDGICVILSYNCIEQKIDTPLICHGFSLFDNGEMLLFKAEAEPRNSHVIQIWQTPFCSPNYSFTQTQSDSILYKIGNKEIVRCMAECRIVQSLLNKDDTYTNLYLDITRSADRIIDTYFWIDKEEGCGLGEILKQIRTTSHGAVEEFEKVSKLKRTTRETIDAVSRKAEEILSATSTSLTPKIETFVKNLSILRSLRGEVISLRDLRYADIPHIDSLEERIKKRSSELSEGCVAFLLTPEGFIYYKDSVVSLEGKITEVQKTTEGSKLDEQIVQAGKELELLLEIVSNLKIEDPTQATQIIEKISSIYSDVNRIRSSLRIKLKELRNQEGAAEFRAQMKLLEQSVANYIDISDSPERCDEYYTKILVQIEELEGNFADYDEFIPELAQRRTDIHSSFETKKAALQEQRSRTCNSLFTAAERILKGIENRLKTFSTPTEINGFLASDLMVEKIRDLAARLVQSGDTVKSDEIQGKLKSIREDALR
ncbi:MAG: AAA family ATPase, partial [Fibrobacter sp.]|nr:AAA family ATPase [Fibrobacter sp.]